MGTPKNVRSLLKKEHCCLFMFWSFFKRQMDPKNQSDFSLLMFCQHFCRILHLIQDANKQYVQHAQTGPVFQWTYLIKIVERCPFPTIHGDKALFDVAHNLYFITIPMFGALPLWNILKMPAEAARQRTKPSKKIIAFIDFNTSLCFWLFSAHCLQVSVISVNFTWDP